MPSIPNNNKDERQQNGPIETVKNEGGVVWRRYYVKTYFMFSVH